MPTTILQQLCSIPTAPFAEQRVIRYVEQFVASRPRLTLSRDSSGNLLIELPTRSRQPRLVFVAHMDHPGFVARRMIDPRTLEANFYGYVLADYVKNTPVRFFDGPRSITGVVTDVTVGKERPAPQSVRIRVSSSVPPHSIGMFDQGEGRVKNGKFHCRVCDDLAGASATLAMLDELHKNAPKTSVAVLLTRAEEEGFIGAIAAAKKPQLLRPTDRILSIECSAEQPYARQGQGVVIRVGDKSSIFNSSLTHFISHQAAQLAKDDKSFRYQRALMPGGTCEATVFDIYGFTAAALCVPLRNYHNMNHAHKTIAPEYIDLTDWQNMLRLFLHLARTAHTYKPAHHLLRQQIEKRFTHLKPLLRSPKN